MREVSSSNSAPDNDGLIYLSDDYLLTYLLTPWSRVLLEKLTSKFNLWVILNCVFYGEGLLAPRPTPQAGGPPLVGCPRLLIQFIHSYPPYWRPFLHPQPEDAPCRDDRDPHPGLVKCTLQQAIFAT